SKSSSLSLIHGHPQQKCKYNKWYTPPISLNDARILCESNLKEIIAVDKFGKTSKLAKKYDNQQFSVEDMQKIEMDIFSVLFKTLPENTINKVKKLGSNKIAADYAFKLATKQQKTKEGMEAINKFWKENADKYKLTYVSDLEYL
ncbi:MAG: hypothetical protein LUG16_07255, partial [Candidatus Gastranaerophilales bacterium]|nr:hypothetical protein [Candidatus Gastranaerophilales bacterium]